jgi:hypothetical protein
VEVFTLKAVCEEIGNKKKHMKRLVGSLFNEALSVTRLYGVDNRIGE